MVLGSLGTIGSITHFARYRHDGWSTIGILTAPPLPGGNNPWYLDLTTLSKFSKVFRPSNTECRALVQCLWCVLTKSLPTSLPFHDLGQNPLRPYQVKTQVFHLRYNGSGGSWRGGSRSSRPIPLRSWFHHEADRGAICHSVFLEQFGISEGLAL